MFRFLLLSLLVVSISAAPNSRRLRLVPDGRIVGGEQISIADAPWQISLQYNSRHICGGSLVTVSLVVTAAHCTYGSTASQLAIRAGSEGHSAGGVVSPVAAIIEHPSYDDWYIDYDISLLRTSTAFETSAVIALVPLPTPNQVFSAGTAVQVTGWGYLREGAGALSSTLQSVTVNIVSNADCSAAYGSLNPVTSRMLCAGVPEGGKDACQGDSGGPLVADGTLAGLTSWGLGCARVNYPGVYASVASLVGWVQSNI